MKQQGIMPHRLYEPSSGAGIFITEALKAFPDLQEVNAVAVIDLTDPAATKPLAILPLGGDQGRMFQWRGVPMVPLVDDDRIYVRPRNARAATPQQASVRY